jgi:hypothetical protein
MTKTKTINLVAEDIVKAQPIDRFVRLGNRVIVLFTVLGFKVAYTLMPESKDRKLIVKFFGYIGQNGPSKSKLKKAIALTDAEAKQYLGKTYHIV